MEPRTLGVFIAVDIIGIIGAILVAVPFFREFGIKKLQSYLRGPSEIPGLSASEEEAYKVTTAALEMFKRGDGIYMTCGLAMIILSYMLHILAEIMEYRGG
jgi:hypothetical protein